MAQQRAIVAVLAGGRGVRLGGTKPSLLLAGSPLVCYPLRAARDAGLEAIVVAKRSTELPELDVPVVYEPDEPSHPLCGVLTALRFAAARPPLEAVLALACDMPFLTGAMLAWLSSLEGAVMARVGGRPQPLLGRWTVAAVPLLEHALANGSSLQAALGSLTPAIVGESELSRFGDPKRLCFNVNDREDLRAARERLAPRG